MRRWSMDNPLKPRSISVRPLSEPTLGHSFANASVHSAAIDYFYNHVSNLDRNLLGKVAAPRMRAAEHHFRALGYTDVKFFHNADGVSAMAYRDPKTNMMFVSFPGTDSAKKALNLGATALRHATGFFPMMESPVGGKIDRALNANLDTTFSLVDRLNGIAPQQQTLVQQLYQHVNDVAVRESTPDSSLKISVGGHSLGATYAAYTAARMVTLLQKDGHQDLSLGLMTLGQINSGDQVFANNIKARLNGNVHSYLDPNDAFNRYLNPVARDNYGYVSIGTIHEVKSCVGKETNLVRQFLEEHYVHSLQCGMEKLQPIKREEPVAKISELHDVDSTESPQPGVPVAYQRSSEQRISIG